MTSRTRAATKKYSNGRVKRLNKEAFKLVEERANEIAEALMKSTIEGKVMSARLLVDLAEGDVDLEEALSKLPLRSLALQLAKEAQWVDPNPDAVANYEAEDEQPEEN
jgi:hypothetical protein